jgi:hypothetical protein
VGELQGDALGDLTCKGNALSLYMVDEHNDAEKLRVAVALAATRQNLANVDYALIDPQFLDAIGVLQADIAGDTADDSVNKLHRDLVQLTSSQVYRIAQHIGETGAVHRFMFNVIQAAVVAALKTKTLDISKVKLEKKHELEAFE